MALHQACSLDYSDESITDVLVILRPVPVRPFLFLARLLLLRLRRRAGIALLLPPFTPLLPLLLWWRRHDESETSQQRKVRLQSKIFKNPNFTSKPNDVKIDVNRL